ncbi:MAG TPA: hypothetical protein VGG85_01730 [Terracidiphilus sp.]|jgi:hypothetical protein
MRKVLPVFCFLLALPLLVAGQTVSTQEWKAKLDHDLPLLGHRNWILIVDSAYPLQTSAGVETVETGAEELDVVRYVMGAIGNSIHVRPDIFMDAELPYVVEEDAPGTGAYREAIAKMFDGLDIQSEPHEKLIADVDQAGKLVHVLVLKTRLTLPYSSVFIRLNCKYWDDDAEERMRAKMGEPTPATAPASETAPVPSAQPTPPPVQQPATQPAAPAVTDETAPPGSPPSPPTTSPPPPQ